MKQAAQAVAVIREGAETFDRAELEAMRDKALDQLAMAKRRLEQLRPLYAIGKVSEDDWVQAEQSVRSAEQKLEGLGWWFDQADERDEERAAADRAASERSNAVYAVSLLHQLGWAMETFDKCRQATGRAAGEIERIEGLLLRASSFVGDEHSQGEFVRAVGVDAAFGTSARIARGLGPLPRFSEEFGFMFKAALQTLAKGLPDVLDDAVREEALAAARADSREEAGEEVGDENR